MGFQNQKTLERGDVLTMPGVELRLTAEHALRAAIDNQVFASLRDLESLDGGRAVQSVYVALMRRLPNVVPDRKRLALDTGFSESSVKRAISLLERSKLVRVERSKGHSSTYVLADIRAVGVASECVAAIKKLARGFSPRREAEGRTTSEPTPDGEGRATSEPGSRVRSEPTVGSVVAHKEANKIQLKQQSAAAGLLERTLRRWGLESASYLTLLGHKQAIPELTDDAAFAARVIEAAMRKGNWSASAGVGSKVAFLREQVPVIIENSSNWVPVRAKFLNGSHYDAEPLDTRPDERRKRAAVVVDAMSETEFTDACKKLYSERPGLVKLYGTPSRDSLGLRSLLVETAMRPVQPVSES